MRRPSLSLAFPGRTVTLLTLVASFTLFAAAALGHSISVSNHGLAVEIDGQSGGVLRLENRLTGEVYRTKAVPFVIETDHGDLPAGIAASSQVLNDGAQFNYQSGNAQVTLTYRFPPDGDFVEKVIQVRNISTSPLVLVKVITDQLEFSPAFREVHPHSDPSQLHWLINLFLRGSRGGFYFGIENPVYHYRTKGHTPPESSLRLDYNADWVLRPGESYTSDPSFLGAFRKEQIYLFKELGKLRQAMSAANAIASALNYDQEILDWGEVWAMQDFMRALQPPHNPAQPGFYVRAVGPIGGLDPSAGFYVPFSPQKVQGSKRFVDTVSELGHIPHVEWATEWFGVGEYGNPTPGFVLENAGPGDSVPVNPSWLEVVRYGWQKGLKAGIFETVGRDFARHKVDWKVKRSDGSLWTWGSPPQPVNCWANREYVKWRLDVTSQAIRDYQLYMVAWDSIVPADWSWLGWPDVDTRCFATNHGHLPGDIRYAIYRNIVWFLAELQRLHPRLAMRVASGLTTDYPWALKNLIEYHPDFYDGETGASFWTSWNFRFLPMYKSGLLFSAKSKPEFEWLLLRSISESDHFMLWGDTVPVALEDKAFWTNWLNWADRNIDYLRVGRTLFREPWGDQILASLPPNLEGRLPAPTAALHGTAHCLKNQGYLFVFNPSAGPRIGLIPLDHRIGLAEGESFVAKVIYPKAGVPYGPYRRGEDLRVQVPSRAVVVINVSAAPGQSPKNRPPVSRAIPVDKAFLSWKEIPWHEILTEP